MSAKFVDALIGYEYFIETRGKASIEDVNAHLSSKGRNPIAQRTYNHYRSLLRYGFRKYFPINQFDVSRLLGQFPVTPDRRRYEREKQYFAAKISVDRNNWIPVTIIDKSIVGFGMTAAKELPLKNGDPIWIRMKRYHDIPALIVWHNYENDTYYFGLRAVEFISRFSVLKEKVAIDEQKAILIIKKSSEKGMSWHELYDLMRKTEKLLDASSELLKYIAELTEKKVKVSSPVLSSIKFSSPGELSIVIDWKIFVLLIALIRIIQNWRIEKEHLGERTRTVRLDNDMREIQIEFVRKTLKSIKMPTDLDITKQLLDALPEWVKKVLNINNLPPTLFEPGSLENRMAKEQLFPVAADLIGGDDPEIEVDAKENSSDKNEDTN